MKKFIAFLLTLFAASIVQASPPEPTKSKYLATEAAGFLVKKGEGVVYSMAFSTLRKVKGDLYGTVLFENPVDEENPLVEHIVVSKGQREVLVQSPLIETIENGRVYKVEFLLFKDADRTVRVNTHMQEVEFSMPTDVASQLGIEVIPPKPRISSTAQLDVENWSFSLDPIEWKLGFRGQDNQQAIIEYIPAGESIENWSSLVTSHLIFAEIDPKQLFDLMIEGLDKDCPSLEYEVLEKSRKSITFEWSHGGCQGYSAQHELKKIMTHRNNTFAISFAKKLTLFLKSNVISGSRKLGRPRSSIKT